MSLTSSFSWYLREGEGGQTEGDEELEDIYVRIRELERSIVTLGVLMSFLSEPPLGVLTSDVALERCDIERMRKKTLQVKRRMTETVGDGDLLSSCLTPTTVDMFLANSNLWEKYKTSWMFLHSLMICLLTQILSGYFSVLTTYLAYFQCLSTFELKVFLFRKFQFMLQFPISSDRFCCGVTVLPVRLWLLLPSINFCRNVFYNKNTKFSGLPGKLELDLFWATINCVFKGKQVSLHTSFHLDLELDP